MKNLDYTPINDAFTVIFNPQEYNYKKYKKSKKNKGKDIKNTTTQLGENGRILGQWNKPPYYRSSLYKGRCVPGQDVWNPIYGKRPMTEFFEDDNHDNYAHYDNLKPSNLSPPAPTEDELDNYAYDCNVHLEHVGQCEHCLKQLMENYGEEYYGNTVNHPSYPYELEEVREVKSMSPFEIFGEFKNIFVVILFAILFIIILDIFMKVRKIK